MWESTDDICESMSPVRRLLHWWGKWKKDRVEEECRTQISRFLNTKFMLGLYSLESRDSLIYFPFNVKRK